jgi:hypothetical protein
MILKYIVIALAFITFPIISTAQTIQEGIKLPSSSSFWGRPPVSSGHWYQDIPKGPNEKKANLLLYQMEELIDKYWRYDSGKKRKYPGDFDKSITDIKERYEYIKEDYEIKVIYQRNEQPVETIAQETYDKLNQVEQVLHKLTGERASDVPMKYDKVKFDLWLKRR